MLGLKLIGHTGFQTDISKGDQIILRKGRVGNLECITIAVMREGKPLLIGNDKVQDRALPLIAFSEFENPDLHQAMHLICDLISLSGYPSESQYTVGNADKIGTIIIQ